jgi:cyclophilin family peptidyl-prolyl cis-trans isomerase
LAAEAQAKKNRTRLRNGGIVVVVAALIVGIAFLVSGNSPKTVSGQSAVKGSTTTTLVGEAKKPSSAQAAANLVATKAGCPASTKATVNTQTYPSAPALTIDPNKLYSATIVTTAGTVEMALYAKAAPTTVNSFVFLANKGYFHCVIFHRVIPGFVDQTGDPTGTGTGGPGYKFANENIPKSYAAGDVAMANSGADTNGSQFFFVVPGGQTQLDGDLSSGGYSLFGHITAGADIIAKINAEGTAAGTPSVTQRIISVTIHEASGV